MLGGGKRRILVVSPHSDDAELGLGGTILRAVDEGHEVLVVVVQCKDENHPGHGSVSSRQRANEFHNAMSVAGVQNHRVLYGNEVGDLLHLSPHRFVTDLDEVIRDYEPDTVLGPVPSFHQEHQYVHAGLVAATRTTKYASSVRLVGMYEYPAAGWGASAEMSTSRGAMYIGIDRYLNGKIKMLECHKSQMYRADDALISFESVRALARLRGIESGTGHAEVIYVMRDVIP